MTEQWGVAANVKAPGTKHFVAGAKVWILGRYWGDGGERTYVYGRHRGGGRYITVVMRTRRLENCRADFLRGHGVESNHWVKWGNAAFPTKDEAAVAAASWAWNVEYWAAGKDTRKTMLDSEVCPWTS